MAYKVQLIYFRQTGKFLTIAETKIACDKLVDIWAKVDDMRRLGELPGLRPGAGRDLFVLVDVPDHPQRILHLVVPPCFDEDDVTPPRRSTGEMRPLVRVPLDEIPRTTTRDVVKIDPLGEVEIDVDVDVDVDADTEIPRARVSGISKPARLDSDAETIRVPDDEVTPVDRPIPKLPDEE